MKTSINPYESLKNLLCDARRCRKQYFQESIAGTADQETRDGYFYEEGRTRAYSEGINAMTDQKAIARQQIEKLKSHCQKVNPTWGWLMREVLEIIDPQTDP